MQSLTKECLLPALFPDVRLPKLVKLATPGRVFVNKNRANDLRFNGAVDITNATDVRFYYLQQAGGIRHFMFSPNDGQYLRRITAASQVPVSVQVLCRLSTYVGHHQAN
jgi:hypothetical protein